MSPVQIGEVFSEVTAEPEPVAAGASAATEPSPWEQLERTRALLAAAAIDADRTRAEGLDA